MIRATPAARPPDSTATRQGRPTAVGLRLRYVFGDGAMLGPGKVELLESIGATGSIAAAGRRMGMSYKRAWLLVEAMNASFRAPLVESRRGGAAHGGACLTPTGVEVLALFRRLEAKARAAGAFEIEELERLRTDVAV